MCVCVCAYFYHFMLHHILLLCQLVNFLFFIPADNKVYQKHCCQLAFFSARFHKTGIFQKRLALRKFQFHLLFGIKTLSTVFAAQHLNSLETVNKTTYLAFCGRGFGILVTGKPGISEFKSCIVVASLITAFSHDYSVPQMFLTQPS